MATVVANRSTRPGSIAAAVVLVAASARCQAQWQAIHLQPQGHLESVVYAARAGEAAGYTWPTVQSGLLPTVWTVPSGATVNLVPSPQTGGIVYGMSADAEAGVVGGHAALWHGSASSFVDLHPSNPNIFYSEARGVRGSQQTGYVAVVPGGDEHAALWTGTASSFVDLHPVGAIESKALATNGSLQAGYATFLIGGGGAQHAAIWNGSASSFQDLNPGPTFGSVIAGMWEDQQVGMYMPFGGSQHAAMWHGTAASLVDLNPGPGSSSYLYASAGIAQVGRWSSSQGNHAAIWFGTAASAVDLSVYLPPAYRAESIAYAVSEFNGQIIVGGYARGPSGAMEAFVWVPAPATLPALCMLGALGCRRRRNVTLYSAG